MLLSSLRSLWSSRSGVFCLLLVWMAVIFSFSMLPGKETAGPPPIWYFIERKGAHVFEYALLTILSFRFFELSFRRESVLAVLGLSMAFALMYGMTDELHQFFVPLRGARFSDVLIDGLGVLLASVVIIFVRKTKTAR